MMSSKDEMNYQKQQPLFQYQPLSNSQIQKEIQLLEQTRARLDKEWKNEKKKYKETINFVNEQTGAVVVQTVPKRNYLNKEGIIQDESLYPYHTALYPLLDAYDCLYYVTADDDKKDLNKLHSNNEFVIRGLDVVIPPCDRVPPDTAYVKGFLPVSYEAILVCLFDKSSRSILNREHNEFLHDLYNGIFDHIENTFSGRFSREFVDMNENSIYSSLLPENNAFHLVQPSNSSKYGAKNLPTNRQERTAILLKLLRHAMSSLQRDYKLVAGILLHMTVHKDLDDIHVYRQCLAILLSEYIPGERFPCSDGTKDGGDIEHFLYLVFGLGITNLTENHAILLCSFVHAIFFQEIGGILDIHLSPLKATSIDVGDRNQMLLQRTIIEKKMREQEHFERKLTKPFRCVIRDIFRICIKERNWMMEYADMKEEGFFDDIVSIQVLQAHSETYLNALRVLVKITETFVQIPIIPEYHFFVTIGSELFRYIFFCLSKTSNEENLWGCYLPDTNPHLRQNKLSCSLRFSNAVVNATKIDQKFKKQRRSLMQIQEKHSDQEDILLQEFQHFFNERPPKDIIGAVRALFVRNAVDVWECGIGYGDFLVWTRCNVNPEDPLLLSDRHNLPCHVNDDESDMEPDYDERAYWDVDENNHIMSYNENKARYHFSLLLLLRAWKAPWKPESHASFQPDFRNAARTVALCSRRLEFPVEIVLLINSYMHRDWWPDATRCCWKSECQELSTVNFSPSEHDHFKCCTPVSLERCQDCSIATYCSEQCRLKDVKKGHKHLFCQIPVLREQPQPQEVQLYCEIFCRGDDSKPPNFLKPYLVPSILEGNRQSNKQVLSNNITDILQIEMAEEDEVSQAGSLETMDSNESMDSEQTEVTQNASSETRLIYDFFKTTMYDSLLADQ